jgi:hypothetical protein
MALNERRTNMDKAQLATELRHRQNARGMVPSHTIDALSDDTIIDTYNTCSGCNAKLVTPQELREIIMEASTAEEFLDLTEAQSHSHSI